MAVEGGFSGIKYEGVVHYHVIKPATKAIIAQEEENKNETTSYFFEASFSSISKTVRIQYQTEIEGQKRILTDEERLKMQFQPSKLWDANPIIVGGALYADILDKVKQQPKLEALQYHFSRQ